MLAACSPRGPLALFQKLSPHDQYAEGLKSAKLDQTGMGKAWLDMANNSLVNALEISLPFKAAGYFAAEKVNASALRFKVVRGQQLSATITIRPVKGFALYADLAQDEDRKIVASADSNGVLTYKVKNNGSYILRLQSELLKGGEYTLTITTGPSLEFPVAVSYHPRIESFWGDSRDNGGRRHEGIDIFAPKGTPALAAAKGTVTRVTENKLGGLVVFMRPDDEDYNLYYADLGKQLVQDGQRVLPGDTVGTIDNTGNAKTTPSHLHFGIYASEGAVDPRPFVDRRTEEPPAFKLPLTRLKDTLLVRHTREPVIVQAVSSSRYLVNDINGHVSWLSGSLTKQVSSRETTLRTAQPLYDRPDTTAARKVMLRSGVALYTLASYQGFELVRYQDLTGWIFRP